MYKINNEYSEFFFWGGGALNFRGGFQGSHLLNETLIMLNASFPAHNQSHITRFSIMKLQ